MTIVTRRTAGTFRTLTGATRAMTLPDAPRVVGGTVGDGQVTVAWTSPEAGGSPITGYTVTLSPGGASASTAAGTTTAAIAATNGTTYSATVRATNGVGLGPASAPSGGLTPVAAGTALVKPDATNTGHKGVTDAQLGRKLTDADLTPHSGSYTLTTPGATYFREVFTQAPTIKADDITFDQCLIRPSTSPLPLYTVLWSTKSGGGRPLRTTFRDTEIDGNGVDGTFGVNPSGSASSSSIQPGIGYTLLRCDVHGVVDGIKPQDNVAAEPILIDKTWVHGLVIKYGSLDSKGQPTPSHNDALQIAGTGARNLTVRRSSFDCYRPDRTSHGDLGVYASSSLIQLGSFPKNADGTSKASFTGVLVEDCWVDGGTLASRISFGGCTTADVTYRRIRLGLRHKYAPLQFFNKADDATTAVVTDAVWDATGTTDSGSSVLAGQAVI